ncbi:MAG: hypothetical protein EOP49_45655, partial [Sphingobacteriales bacterium]
MQINFDVRENDYKLTQKLTQGELQRQQQQEIDREARKTQRELDAAEKMELTRAFVLDRETDPSIQKLIKEFDLNPF